MPRKRHQHLSADPKRFKVRITAWEGTIMPLSLLNHLRYRGRSPASGRLTPLPIPHDWEQYLYSSILVSESQISFLSDKFRKGFLSSRHPYIKISPAQMRRGSIFFSLSSARRSRQPRDQYPSCLRRSCRTRRFHRRPSRNRPPRKWLRCR